MQNPKYLPWDQERWPVAAYYDDHIVRLTTEPHITVHCAVCNEEVNLVLDLYGFTAARGDVDAALAHARCLWLAERFHNEAKRAPEEWPDN